MIDFANRLKKEMCEGAVKAILEQAGYRVDYHGVEVAIAGISQKSKEEYLGMELPKSVRFRPDFMVFAKGSSANDLVEVRYRANWSISVLRAMRRQVEAFDKVVLVTINPRPEISGEVDANPQHLRCCRMRCHEGEFQAQLWDSDARAHYWAAVSSLTGVQSLWLKMSPLPEVFEQLKSKEHLVELDAVATALSGLFGNSNLPTMASTKSDHPFNDGDERATSGVQSFHKTKFRRNQQRTWP